MASNSASGLFGRVGEFNVARETFSAYVERMEMFFTANNIVTTTGEGSAATNLVVANRKRAIFLTEVGPEVYTTTATYWRPLNRRTCHSLTLWKSWRNTTTRSPRKSHKVFTLAREIKNPKNQLAIMCWL